MATDEPLNPVRPYALPRQNKPMQFGTPPPCTWGFVPQTWSDPQSIDPNSNAKGSGAPLEAIEIGGLAMRPGQVAEVKVVAALGMIEDGRSSWKLLTLHTRHPAARDINDVEDLDDLDSELTTRIRSWFFEYPLHFGRFHNELLFEGDLVDKARSLHCLSQRHADWRQLVAGVTPSSANVWIPPRTPASRST